MVFVKKMCSVKIEKGEKFRTFFFSGWSVEIFIFYFILFLFYFICHIIITKNKGKEREKRSGDET